MPGHMGVDTETVKNLTVVDIKPKDNLLLLKGAVPGPKTGIIKIFKTNK
jgi:large subunit ribosomal protein L3